MSNVSRTAIHEAGHVVVADALGLWVAAVERHPEEDGPNGLGWRVVHMGPEEPTPWESYTICAVALAGGCAEMLAHGDPGSGNASDLDQAHAMAGAAESEDSGVDDAMPRAAWLAASILSARWDAVLAVASAMDERGELDAIDLGRMLAGYHEPGGATLGRLDAPTVVPQPPTDTVGDTPCESDALTHRNHSASEIPGGGLEAPRHPLGSAGSERVSADRGVGGDR